MFTDAACPHAPATFVLKPDIGRKQNGIKIASV